MKEGPVCVIQAHYPILHSQYFIHVMPIYQSFNHSIPVVCPKSEPNADGDIDVTPKEIIFSY
jgi:hypothetical protein